LQKISRRGSSSKFNIPGFGKKREKASDIGTPDETDEDLSRSVDSVGGSPLVGGASGSRSSVLSWSSLRKKSKKTEETPSLSESLASETGDEEDVSTPGVNVMT